jgi:hypothetical protein
VKTVVGIEWVDVAVAVAVAVAVVAPLYFLALFRSHY